MIIHHIIPIFFMSGQNTDMIINYIVALPMLLDHSVGKTALQEVSYCIVYCIPTNMIEFPVPPHHCL